MKRPGTKLSVIALLCVAYGALSAPLFDDPFCPPVVAETADLEGALEAYLSLLRGNALISPESRMAIFKRYAELSPEPQYTAYDLFDSALQITQYRARVQALEARERARFEQLRAGFPPDRFEPELQSQLVWQELTRMTGTPADASELTLFHDNSPVAVYRSRDMRSLCDEMISGHYHVIPTESRLWAEFLHGITVLIDSGVLEENDVDDLRMLRAKWAALWIGSFDDGFFRMLSSSRQAQSVFLEIGLEFLKDSALKSMVLGSLFATPSLGLLELQQHFLSLLVVEISAPAELLARIRAKNDDWSGVITPRDPAILQDALIEYRELRAGIEYVLTQSRERLNSTNRKGRLPNILWADRGIELVESLLPRPE